ncbi:hypothetical protein [Halorubrum persicum]|uniref:hypothetical protein n=1 Tax=Halorubrum persicum TaxID=1383844 RepID=UPI001FEA4BC4|nr:hypothetical protein [Halorubrum persicum]
MIDTYETIVEERSETEHASESDASNESKGWRPLGAVASWVERAAARLRRPNE